MVVFPEPIIPANEHSDRFSIQAEELPIIKCKKEKTPTN